MLPYLAPPGVQLGPLSIQAFGIAVGVALIAGMELARRQFRRRGLDLGVGQGLTTWVLIGGLLGAHLFSVLLYFPQKLARDPWLLLRVWEDISSFGGILGGLVGALLFFGLRVDAATRALRWAYLDAVALIFPVALAIGRFGCALAHDHPGTLTTFPLAISARSPDALTFIRSVYADAGRALPTDVLASSSVGFHDLGWYEFLFLTFVVVPVMQWCQRRTRRTGFYLLLFPALYLPVRFGLDFLRVSDVRYAGLTPAQWVAVVVLAGLPVVWGRVRRNGRMSFVVAGGQ